MTPLTEAAYDPSRSACSAMARHFRAISNTILLAGSKDSKLATRSYSLALARYSFCFGRHDPGPLKVRYPTQCGNQVLRSLKSP
jgi:hypothetical protein